MENSQQPDVHSDHGSYHSSQETLLLPGAWEEDNLDAMDEQVQKATEASKENKKLDEIPPTMNFYQRMFSKECLEATQDATDPTTTDSARDDIPDDGEEGSNALSDDDNPGDLSGYKMITPPGCPVCIMSNADSEGKQSELTPQKILEILCAYMDRKDAMKTFDEMMQTTSTTTQAQAQCQSASSSSVAGEGNGI